MFDKGINERIEEIGEQEEIIIYCHTCKAYTVLKEFEIKPTFKNNKAHFTIQGQCPECSRQLSRTTGIQVDESPKIKTGEL